MNNQIQQWTPRPLPKFEDLSYDIQAAFKDDELLRLLHQPANMAWVKQHPMIKVKVDGKFVPLQYVPIEKVKYLLTRIFGIWHREIREVKPFFNSSLAIVRVIVKHPFTGEELWHDGVGAAPMQTDAGTSASDLINIKSDAALKAGGSSVSYALKNACDCFGPIFGSNLQNPEAIQFTGSYQAAAKHLKEEASKGNGDAALAYETLTTGLPEITTSF